MRTSLAEILIRLRETRGNRKICHANVNRGPFQIFTRLVAAFFANAQFRGPSRCNQRARHRQRQIPRLDRRYD